MDEIKPSASNRLRDVLSRKSEFFSISAYFAAVRHKESHQKLPLPLIASNNANAPRLTLEEMHETIFQQRSLHVLLPCTLHICRYYQSSSSNAFGTAPSFREQESHHFYFVSYMVAILFCTTGCLRIIWLG